MWLNTRDIAIILWLREGIDIWRDQETWQLNFRDQKIVEKVALLLSSDL